VPEWASTGFSDGARIPYVMGERGRIAALLFGWPLAAPPSTEHSNKILWRPRKPAVPPYAPMLIKAQLYGGTTPVTRTVPGGPGPSIVDLPTAGCWHLELTWPGGADSLNLPYSPP
jgi:hypothetical protein